MKLDRLNKMEHYIFRQGHASLEELAEKFDVSLNTVRRDVAELLKTGSIQKVYGGVVASPTSSSTTAPTREQQQPEAKQIIAQLAANCIQDNTTIFLDSGTTVSALIPYLNTKENITVVTNSLRVMEQIRQYPKIYLFSLGGFYSPDAACFEGVTVLENLKRISFTEAFLGANAIDLTAGMTVSRYYEETIKHHILTHCGKNTTLLVDSYKFDRSTLFSFGNLQDVGRIITDSRPPLHYINACAEAGIELIYP